MSGPNQDPNDFLRRIDEILLKQLPNEKFGVSELAAMAGMSRSSLLRNIKKHTDLSANRYIRKVRLNKSMEMLQDESISVSEVAFSVGFSSTSYFVKCFHDEFGYPPGQVSLHKSEKEEVIKKGEGEIRKWSLRSLLMPIIIFILVLLLGIFYIKPLLFKKKSLEKSIAVLPFINDSDDPSNTYIINGLMEAILNNLQKIDDLQVASRTSAEKYRNLSKSIPEIAEELGVNYFVEGSGQKVGDKILLYVQLIQGPDDRHLWSGHFQGEGKDIFQLQMDVAKAIAEKVKANITPGEIKQIEKIPTDNLLAYDLFLKGRQALNQGESASVLNAIQLFHKAIKEDNAFARAYAAVAISYYFLDARLAEKSFTDSINVYADKAMYYDSELAQSQLAKALYYMNTNAYTDALPYFEKALKFQPNSDLVLGFLSDFYANYLPDTEKYLKYALQSIRLDIASKDSVSTSYIYLHLSNALIQSGFVDEAVKYIDLSIAYDDTNLFSEYVKAYILYAKNKDLKETRTMLYSTYLKDTFRYDVIQELAKICYFQRDFDQAFKYYQKFLSIKNALQLDVYRLEDAKISVVFKEMGFEAQSDSLLNKYKEYAESDNTIYRELSLSTYYARTGNVEESLKHFKNFSEENSFHYWLLLFMEIDPLTDDIRGESEYKLIFNELKEKFWEKHNKTKAILAGEKLL